MPAVVVRQRKAWRRRDGVFLYFEVNLVLLPIPFTLMLTYDMITILGQRRCHREPQGRNEGICDYWTCCKRMCACSLSVLLTPFPLGPLNRVLVSVVRHGEY